jgi:hypothetical protein
MNSPAKICKFLVDALQCHLGIWIVEVRSLREEWSCDRTPRKSQAGLGCRLVRMWSYRTKYRSIQVEDSLLYLRVSLTDRLLRMAKLFEVSDCGY